MVRVMKMEEFTPKKLSGATTSASMRAERDVDKEGDASTDRKDRSATRCDKLEFQ